MAIIYSSNISKNQIRFPVDIQYGNKVIFYNAMFDTGAAICYITYALWYNMGADNVIFDDSNKQETILGDGSKIPAYDCYFDINIGKAPVVKLENIKTRLIYSKEAEFILGRNILRYLDFHYVNSSTINTSCFLELTDVGRQIIQRFL